MINARIKAENPEANLKSYTKTYNSFSWADAEKEFTWHSTGRLNIVYEAIDRWMDVPEKKARKALIFNKEETESTYSFDDLKKLSCQWANMLTTYGCNKGDRIFIFLPPCPEVYFSILACSRLGIIFCPLYSTLGYNELEERIRDAEPRGIITHPDLAERLPFDDMASVKHLFFTHGPLPGLFSSEINATKLIDTMDVELEPQWLKTDSPLFLIYTSGSTGPPKGVVHTHGDMLGYLVTAKYVLNVQNDTTLWTDGDPSWITGTVYSTFAPWLCGATSVVQGSPFSASTWYRTLEINRVTEWYTTPMTIKKLIRAGEDLPTRYDFSHLRHLASVGESLLPELFYWVRKNLNHSAHDTWWMSECGMICLANFPSMDIKAGAMGKAVPGIEAAILDEQGEILPLLTLGELSLKVPWPAMMTDIWRNRRRYNTYFRHNGWFSTGDMAIMDEDGYFHHQGRMDDLIKVGEKLIGPYEIEQVLNQHPAVMEVAVIYMGAHPDETLLKAFIVVSGGHTPSNRLKQEIKAYIKGNLSSDIPLKEVAFLDKLPKTSTGKLLRRVLRAQELGLPAGDVSGMKD